MIALSEPPAPKEAVCCWCGATTPVGRMDEALPMEH